MPSRQMRRSFDFRFPSLQKNRDNMKLLVSYPDFQKDVEETREYLEIPPCGLDLKNGKEIKQWNDKLIKKSDEIMGSPGFFQQEKMIKERLKKKEIGVRMAKKQSKLLYNKVPINYLTDTSEFLAEKFLVPQNYEEYIREYILFGTINAPPNDFSLGYWPAWTLPSGVRYIPIKIYTRLTNPDLRELKRYIEWAGKQLPKFQTLKNIDKKLTVEKWMENRIKYDEVEQKEYKMTTAEIAENLLNRKSSAKKIYETIRGLKELREKRFGKQ